MFTGIVEDVGRIASIAVAGPGRRLRIATGLPADGFALGDSVAVSGVCLTVTAIGEGHFDADASHETVGLTTLAERRVGDRVNLERALRVGDRLGGHFVTGHVDARGVLRSRRQVGEAWDIELTLPAELHPQIVQKGSVALDGVSLTVNRCRPGLVGVTVIPHTGQQTTLLDLPLGSAVNVETDVLGKYVVHVLGGGPRPRGGSGDGALKDALERGGFL